MKAFFYPQVYLKVKFGMNVDIVKFFDNFQSIFSSSFNQSYHYSALSLSLSQSSPRAYTSHIAVASHAPLFHLFFDFIYLLIPSLLSHTMTSTSINKIQTIASLAGHNISLPLLNLHKWTHLILKIKSIGARCDSETRPEIIGREYRYGCNTEWHCGTVATSRALVSLSSG